MMIAVPSAVFVQRGDEQVRVLEVLQGFLAVIPGGNRVTERAAHPVEDGGLEQEDPQRFRLAREHLFGQVVNHVAVTARESGDEARDVGAVSHGQRRQLQPCYPTLGALLQFGDILGRQSCAHYLPKESRGLLRREAQVGSAQLGHFSSRSQACQRQGWIRPRGDDQVHLRREVLDKEGERLVDRPRLDYVVVVEDKHRVGGQLRELV